jgi:hypothetical protein
VTSLRDIARIVASALALSAFVLAALPPVALYRCRMMGTIVDAPCCPTADADRARDSNALTADACYERLPTTALTVDAMQGSADAQRASVPASHLVPWAPPSPALAAPDRPELVTTRGSPPEQRLRVPTIVLRV